MNKSELIKRAVVSAVATGVYVVALVFGISHSNQWFGEQDLGWFVAVFMLLLFIISACVTSSLVLLKPILLYVEGKKREGVTLFIYTVISLVVLALLVGGFLLSGLAPKLPY